MGDLIDRQAAIDAIKAARVEDDGTYRWRTQRNLDLEFAAELLEALPSAQPDRGHAEQIKWERDIAIQQLKELGYFFDEEFAEGIAEISLFPSAQPERKVGRWIDMDDHVMCSCCGAAHYGVDKNFCPNCGADMREEEQDEADRR